MMSKTSRLKLPYIHSNQAQKEITYNEALNLLDSLINPVVKETGVFKLPPDAKLSDSYVINNDSFNDLKAYANYIAIKDDCEWRFIHPIKWMRVTLDKDGSEYRFNGKEWVAVSSGAQNVSVLAAQTSALPIATSQTTAPAATTKYVTDPELIETVKRLSIKITALEESSEKDREFINASLLSGAKKDSSSQSALNTQNAVSSLSELQYNRLADKVNYIDKTLGGKIYKLENKTDKNLNELQKQLQDQIQLQTLLSNLLESQTKEIAALKNARVQNQAQTLIASQGVSQNSTLAANLNAPYLIKKDSGEYLQVISLQEEITLKGAQNQTNIKIPHHSILLAVNIIVTDAITGAKAFNVGIKDNVNTFGSNLSTAKGATNVGLNNNPTTYWSDTSVLISASEGAFTSGKVAVNIQALKPHGPWKWE